MSKKHFYCFGPFRLSETEGVLRRGSDPIPLGSKAIDTLLVLVRNQQSVVSRDELMKAVWPDSVVDENNLDALRRARGNYARPDSSRNPSTRVYTFAKRRQDLEHDSTTDREPLRSQQS